MTTATDGPLLLAAIRACPEDDLVRLAYADWLDESGQAERALYVRDEIAGRTGSGTWRGWPDSMTRLTGGDPDDGDTHPERRGWDWRWRRGFVESVRCPLAEWQKHGPKVVRAHPVTRVELTDREPYQLQGYTRFRWYRTREPVNHVHRHCLPPWLHHVKGEELEPSPPLAPRFAYYVTREAALDALSFAALAWADLPEGQR